MKEVKVSEKLFLNVIHSAIGGNLEVGQVFVSSFKKKVGGKKCQLKR